MTNILQDAQAGSTNLTCRHCNTPIDLLDMPSIDMANIAPNNLFCCPHCGSGFFPEIGVLHTLFREGDINDIYFGQPLTLGGTAIQDLNHVSVGETQPVQMHDLYEGYEYTAIFLQDAHKEGVEKSNWEDFDLAGGYNRATLGGNILINLIRTNPTDIAINATLETNSDDSEPIKIGDRLAITYTATVAYSEATNPPWIELLIEAQAAIREDLPLTAIPLLRSAVDNCLIRQAYLYLIWNRPNRGTALREVEDIADGDYEPNRHDIAKQGLENWSGVRLTNGPYADLWSDFSEVVRRRDSIIHSEMESSLEPLDQDTARDLYDTTISLLVGAYDLFWHYEP